MSDFHLAQLNTARMRYPLDRPEMAGFMAMLDPINQLAESSDGFVWRCVADSSNNATDLRPFPDTTIVMNLSVWQDRRQLRDFVYHSRHLDVLRHRAQWFTRVAEHDQVLWWIPAGTIPTVPQALERLELLRTHGPTPRAFTFRQSYDHAGNAESGG